jgi:hypothetical protein
VEKKLEKKFVEISDKKIEKILRDKNGRFGIY